MYSLILKDILLQKKSFWFAGGYSVFILVAFQNEAFKQGVYIMGAMACAYFFIMGGCAYDGKDNGEVLLNSLPLSRRDVVLAKYCSVFVFMFLSLALIGLLGALMRGVGLPFPVRLLNAVDILGVALTIVFLSSLYLPVYYKFGYIKSRGFNLVIFIVIFFVPNLVLNYLLSDEVSAAVALFIEFINRQPDWLIGVAVILGLFAIVYCSYRLSLYFYQRKDF